MAIFSKLSKKCSISALAVLATVLVGKISTESPMEYEFKADTRKVLDTFTKNVYSNSEVFFRELISNSSDALHKLRYESLVNEKALESNPNLEIYVFGNQEKNSVTITDSGVGMTKEELIENLGTISKSGTAKFDKATNSDNLIGQFGIGFYSSFLVSDKVTVISKTVDSKACEWSTTDNGKFLVRELSPEETPEDLTRGTRIILDLKKEYSHMAKTSNLEDLVKKFSSYIDFPIKLWTEKTITEEVPLTEEELAAQEEEKAKDAQKAAEAEEAKKKEAEEKGENPEEADDAEEPAEKETPKEYKTTKKVEKIVREYVKVNVGESIWLKKPSDLTPEKYNDFYRISTKDTTDPLAYSHFSVEGDVGFKALVFVPAKAPFNPTEQSEDKKEGRLSLYVRKVFISKELQDLVPDYLSFICGVIDSEDLPLNISREAIQNGKQLLAPIKKSLVSKVILMLKNLAKDDPEKFLKFWKAYSTFIKMGIKDDSKNREKLSELLRFNSSFASKEGEKSSLVSLEAYVSRLKDKQSAIFFACGRNIDEILKSPHAEAALKRGYEILLFDDPYDQYVAKTIAKYKDHKFQDIGEQDFSFGDESEEDKKVFSDLKESFKPLSDYLVKILDSEIDSVVISNKLTDSPCAVTSKNFGVSGYMLKVMNSQAGAKENPYLGFLNSMKKTLEINPKHPSIVALNDKVKSEAVDDDLSAMTKLLYQAALISSGYDITDPKMLMGSIDTVIRKVLNIDLNAKPEVEVKPAQPAKPADPADETEKTPEADAVADEHKDHDGSDHDGHDHGSHAGHHHGSHHMMSDYDDGLGEQLGVPYSDNEDL